MNGEQQVGAIIRSQYDRQSQHYGGGPVLENVDDVKKALRGVFLQPGQKALEVAAGGGYTGLYLASLGLQVTLSDTSSEILQEVQKLAAECGLNITIRQHLAEMLPYPDATFDLVVCRLSAHHFSSPLAFVLQTARILKPGGALILIDVSFPDDQGEAGQWMDQLEKLRDPTHQHILAPSQWGILCEQAHLNVQTLLLEPHKQPDMTWYCDLTSTPEPARQRMLDHIQNVPPSVRRLFWVGTEANRVVWWWKRLSLVATRSAA
jgi:ubiquinone/menaquinone biosynthesis C-methylase UbiE